MTVLEALGLAELLVGPTPQEDYREPLPLQTGLIVPPGSTHDRYPIARLEVPVGRASDWEARRLATLMCSASSCLMGAEHQ